MNNLEKNIEKLKKMCGKLYKKDNAEFRLLTYKQTDTDIEIITDGEWYKTNIFDLAIFLDSFKEVILPVLKRETVEIKPKFIAVKNESVDRVQSSLLDMLEQIKTNNTEESRQQAASVIKISDAVLRAEKMKIELLNAANRL